jgi:oxygen-independent coproporphyrinogen-3 oxidase
MQRGSKGAEVHDESLREELRRRMSRSQRHRLLQGYPMAPLMPEMPEGLEPFDQVQLDSGRPLIIGVLPHTFCNPKVKGCGFCTFPHEQFAHEPMRRVLEQVAREIERTATTYPSLRQRRVEAVYLGGGTANLTPPEELQRLCTQLEGTFELGQCELTLEGVPRYFLLRDEALLDVLGRAHVRHRRISMGVQTFDPQWLRRMGRDAFGDPPLIQQVVEAAHRRGFTASADLLFNLPGRSLGQTLEDVRCAIDIGFDQICVYNLVLTAELDTEWAREAELVRAMPETAKACATWLAVREALLERGFVQTTLTNFERRFIARTPRRFLYELASFKPAQYDALGFGPGAISTFTGRVHRRALKWMNVASSEAFVQAMSQSHRAVARMFAYGLGDLRLLHLTRNLARLSIDRSQYKAFFGSDPLADFEPHFRLLEEAGLVHLHANALELTPEGMFYADAVAGLLAHQRVVELRNPPRDDDSAFHHMG